MEDWKFKTGEMPERALHGLNCLINRKNKGTLFYAKIKQQREHFERLLEHDISSTFTWNDNSTAL